MLCTATGFRKMDPHSQLRLPAFRQEKVEEDRFMRAQERAYIEKMQAEMKAQKREDDEAAAAMSLHALMDEIESLLKETGDSVSPMGLENLAKWK